MSDRRSSPRIDAKIEVEFKNGSDFARCYTENLSQGGILLETTDLPDPNAVIEIVMALPNSEKKKLYLKGRVVRRTSVSVDSRTVHKVALQFIDVSAETQSEIDRLYEVFSASAQA